eukprot:SAG22_NODE_10404_length_537_cov_0.828767_2_plen_36_part_01
MVQHSWRTTDPARCSAGVALRIAAAPHLRSGSTKQS